MNETEAAKLFNEELDALLRGAHVPTAPSDPGALALAAEFARADYSAESRVRDTLRERLVGRPAGFAAALKALLSNNYARAAFAAAVIVVALLPLARREPAGPAPAQPPAVTQPLAAVQPLPAPPRARLSAAAAPAAALFASLPMGKLEAVRVKEFPIAPAGSGLPMALAPGRPIATAAAGEPLKLETESAGFPIESRPVSPEDIFERRTL